MPVFSYKAIDQAGKSVSGIVDADSATSARQKLRQGGVFPVELDSLPDPGSARPLHMGGWLARLRRIRRVEIALTFRQLATLTGAGFPLVAALDALISQSRSVNLKKTLAQVKTDILSGSSFSAALGRYPNVFSTLSINMIKAGERSGTLVATLDRLADITERQVALMHRIQVAMVYPVLMSVVGLLVVFFLMTHVVPSMAAIFADMQQNLPLPTRLLMAVSHWLRTRWWVLALVLAAVAVLIRFIYRSTAGRRLVDRMVLRMPHIGPIVRQATVARLGITLGCLLENGVPLVAALDVACDIVANTRIRSVVSQAARLVEQGDGLAAPLANHNVLPQLALQMIEVGEQSGSLEAMLRKISEVYEQQVSARLLALTAVIEPVMILIMGTVVGFIVLAVCLPIFEMNQLIK